MAGGGVCWESLLFSLLEKTLFGLSRGEKKSIISSLTRQCCFFDETIKNESLEKFSKIWNLRNGPVSGHSAACEPSVN